MYESIKFSECVMNAKTISNLVSLALIDPDGLGFITLGQKGFYGRVTGEVIRLIQCKPVIVSLRESENKCYNEIPVNYNDKKMFVSPTSRILLNDATEISCIDSLQPLFLIDNVWCYTSGKKFVEYHGAVEDSFHKPADWKFMATGERT